MFFFPGSNITCFTFYIHLWCIYWRFLVLGISWVAERLAASQEGLTLTKIVFVYLLDSGIPTTLPPNSSVFWSYHKWTRLYLIFSSRWLCRARPVMVVMLCSWDNGRRFGQHIAFIFRV
jgi:hypothetical protein